MTFPTEIVAARRLGGELRAKEFEPVVNVNTSAVDVATADRPSGRLPRTDLAPRHDRPPSAPPPTRDLAQHSSGTASATPTVATRGAWTAGRDHVSTLARLGVWLLVLAGPAALIWVATTRPAPTPAAVASIADPGPVAAVAAAAQIAGATWVAGANVAALPAAATVEMTPPDDPTATGPQTWSVLVAVFEPAAAAPDAGAAPLPPTVTYLQVPMVVDVQADGLPAISPLGRPAVVPGPAAAQSPASAYTTVLPISDPRAAAGAAFVVAMVTGGDVIPLTAPGSALRAVSPAPAAAVEVREVAVATWTEDGADEIHLAVTAVLTAPASPVSPEVTAPSRATTYYLTLRQRDDRWEVAALLPGPAPDTTDS